VCYSFLPRPSNWEKETQQEFSNVLYYNILRNIILITSDPKRALKYHPACVTTSCESPLEATEEFLWNFI
jgi:hypothetical protein